MERKKVEPVGYITLDGGRVVGQGERDIGVEVWFRDQNGRPFIVHIKLNRSAFEGTERTRGEPDDPAHF